MEDPSFTLEPNQIVWGVTSTIALIYGSLMYSWYPSEIKSNNVLYPNASGTAVSETWALETREIKAWTNASEQIIAIQSLAFFTWGYNLAFGQNGNPVH
jgi:hypothetical protein